jgi:hypothetical protein
MLDVTGTNMTGTKMIALANVQDLNQADFQIAQGLADKVLVIFVRSAHLTASNNDPQAILSVFSSPVTLKTAIDNAIDARPGLLRGQHSRLAKRF